MTEKDFIQKKPICSISLANLLLKLHEHAAKQAQKGNGKDYNIINSNIRSNNRKLQFTGAGQQVIVITSLTGNIKINDLLKALNTYIKHFTGVNLNIEQSDLHPIYDKKTIDNSLIYEKQQILSNIYQLLFEAKYTDNLKKDDEEEDAEKFNNKVIGYYIKFETKTGDRKNVSSTSEDSIWQSIKNTLTDMIDGTYTASYDWKSGSVGEKHFLGAMLDNLSNAIDAEKLPRAFEEQLRLDYPGMDVGTTVLSTKSIINYLKSRLYDENKEKISSTEYAFCIKINKQEKNYELINTTYLAKILNRSIERSSFDKMFGINKIKENNIVLINNYSDNLKDRDDIKRFGNGSRRIKLNTDYDNLLMNNINNILDKLKNDENDVNEITTGLEDIYNRHKIKDCINYINASGMSTSVSIKNIEDVLNKLITKKKNDRLTYFFKNYSIIESIFERIYYHIDQKNLENSIPFYVKTKMTAATTPPNPLSGITNFIDENSDLVKKLNNLFMNLSTKITNIINANNVLPYMNTPYDFYIVPMKNLKFKRAQPKTKMTSNDR